MEVYERMEQLAEAIEGTLPDPEDVGVEWAAVIREWADEVRDLIAIAREHKSDDAQRIHMDECPDCGAPDYQHVLDPPWHCTHPRDCYVPVEYVRTEPGGV
jgi:hypothetical protein